MPHSAAGDAHRAPRVAADGESALPGGGGRAGAAAGAPGDAGRVPGVMHVAVVVVPFLGDGPVGQRVQVRLADQNRPGLLQPGHDPAVLRCDAAVEGLGAQGAADPPRREQVLHGEGQAVQRALPVPRSDVPFRLTGLFQGLLRKQGDEGVQRRFQLLAARQIGLHQLHRRNLLAADERGQLAGAPVAQLRVTHPAPQAEAGTRCPGPGRPAEAPPGAGAWACSGG